MLLVASQHQQKFNEDSKRLLAVNFAPSVPAFYSLVSRCGGLRNGQANEKGPSIQEDQGSNQRNYPILAVLVTRMEVLVAIYPNTSS